VPARRRIDVEASERLRKGLANQAQQADVIALAPRCGKAGADFSSASSVFKVLGACFCPFATLSFSQLVSRSRTRSAVRLCTISCRFEASQTLPFRGADSIFSSHCGAISGPFCRQPLAPQFRRTKRLDPSFVQTLVLRAQKLRPPRGASEARRAPKTPYHELCLYERKTPKNRSRPFQGKIAPEDAASCEAITGDLPSAN